MESFLYPVMSSDGTGKEMRRCSALIALVMAQGAVAGPGGAEDRFTVAVSGHVDAVCDLSPEGFADDVTGTLEPGETYTLDQGFEYGCNAPYRLVIATAFGELRNVTASGQGQSIGIPYTLTFGDASVTLDQTGRAVLAEATGFQSLHPRASHFGTVELTAPASEDIVAGTYREVFTITLASTL